MNLNFSVSKFWNRLKQICLIENQYAVNILNYPSVYCIFVQFESVIDQFKQKDTIKYNTIKDAFASILNDYNKKSKKLIESYTILKEKEDDSVAKQNQYNTRIKKLIVSLSILLIYF